MEVEWSGLSDGFCCNDPDRLSTLFSIFLGGDGKWTTLLAECWESVNTIFRF